MLVSSYNLKFPNTEKYDYSVEAGHETEALKTEYSKFTSAFLMMDSWI